MDLSERLFAAPEPDAARAAARQAALPPRVRALIQRASDALARGDAAAAQPALAQALALVPDQADVLRLYGLLLAQVGNLPAAFANFEAALRAAPDDALGYWEYSHALEASGDLAAALALRQRAVQRLPRSPLAWQDLGEHLYSYGAIADALAALERVVALAPDYAPGQFKLGDGYVACGRTDEGVAAIRRALAIEPAFGAAWMALVDVKTAPVTEAEIEAMHALLAAGSRADAHEQTAIEFALAMALERAGRYDEAWQHVVHANARRRQEVPPWSAQHFREQERAATEVFAHAIAAAPDPRLGEQVIFIVGMPRSGTTLVEQILGAHRDVRGAGELAALPQVLTEESTRRQVRYPGWAPQASAADWRRMGERYLELTAIHRGDKRVSTDKLPNNWRALGAIRAMLPGAHIVVCRRDPLENCWSCFKQYFADGWEFSYALDDLALFWHGFDAAARAWRARRSPYVREQRYEALAHDSPGEIRDLLAFCGLEPDANCLHPEKSQRSVLTLSAAQVREPIHGARGVTGRYGALLDPLRVALGLPCCADAPAASLEADGGAA
ncbi:MAG TPA: sulfotransferase [Rhodanobacteraceae bacterium]